MGPARPLVFKLTLPHDVRRPSIGEASQVYFSRSDRGRLPIDGIDTPVAIESMLQVILSVDDGWWWLQQGSDKLLPTLAQSCQPWKALMQSTSKLRRPAYPFTVVGSIV